MPFKDPEARRAYQRSRYAASKPPIGRPMNIEGEKMVVANQLLASTTRPSGGGVYFLPVDDIITRQGWKTYKDMLHDDQVKACLTFKKILICGRQWEIKPSDETPEAKRVAAFVDWALRETNFQMILREALSAIEFGFSLGELVWQRKQWNYEGADTQVVCLKKIAHRDPQNLEIKMDAHGNVEGVRQMAGLPGMIELGPEKFWLFTHNKRFGDPYGLSDLRSAYRSYWAKKFVVQFWNVYLERMGSPMTKMSYPNGSSQDLKDNLKAILTNLGSKTEILVPQGVEISLIEATRGGVATYEAALSFHDQSIARALLMVGLMGMSGDKQATRGTPAQSDLHLRVMFKMVDEISQDLTNTLMAQVIRQLVDFNFAPNTDLPKFVWQDYGQFEGLQVLDMIRLFHAAGVLELDQTDVNYARSVLGLQLRVEGMPPDDVIRPQPMPPPADSNTPPPAAEQGNQRTKKGAPSTNSVRKMALVLQEIEDEVSGT